MDEMSPRDISSEPVRTVDGLVTSLQQDLPPGTSFEDGLARRPLTYFTLERFDERFADLVVQATDSTHLVKGETKLLGQKYETRTRTFTHNGVPLATSVIYNDGEVPEDERFYPEKTLKLYGTDPETMGSLEIALTQYRKANEIPGAPEVSINVYMLTETADPLALLTGEESEETRKVIVGAPDWDINREYDLARSFGMIPVES